MTLGRVSFAEHTESTDSGHFWVFWCLFFKPTCSLGSAGKQDIPREGKWSREEDSAARRRAGPTARPLLLQPGAQAFPPGSPAEEGGPLSDMHPLRPRQRSP